MTRGIWQDIIAATSMSADFTSSSSNVQSFEWAEIVVIWTGSDALTSILLQGGDGTNFNDISDSTFQMSIGSGSHIIDMQVRSFEYLRASFSHGSATTGTISVTVRKKKE